MKKQKYVNEKGVTSVDIIISVIIIVLFVSVITTAFYNYYKSTQSKNRVTMATNIIIDVIENVEMLPYDDVNTENVNKMIEDFKADGTIQQQYTVSATIQKYNETEGNTQKKDLIKILKVKVTYSETKEESIEITRLITK